MRILVTGATGFLGRRLVDFLLEEGHEPVALVRGGKRDLPSRVRQVVGDLHSVPQLEAAARGCSRLYHLAANVSFNARERNSLLEVNAAGTGKVLEAAARAGVDRILVVSSACTFGLSGTPIQFITEESTATPAMVAANPYLESKLACEAEALKAAAAGQRVVVACPSTVYGPGDYSLNSGTLVKKVATSRALPVPAGGSNLVDVDDVIRGLVIAAERGRSGERYLLAGENLSFWQIFSLTAKVTGNSPLLLPMPTLMRAPMTAAAWLLGTVSPNRLLTPQIIADLFSFKYYSTQKAARELAWLPEFTSEQTLERAWRFYRENGLF